MQYIGRLDKKKTGKYAKMIITDEIVLTDERKAHIYNSHKRDYKTIMKNIQRISLNPDIVMEDIKNKDTLFFIGKLKENNLNVIIKLNTINSINHPQNSIMTAWIIRNSNLKKLKEKNKIIYINE